MMLNSNIKKNQCFSPYKTNYRNMKTEPKAEGKDGKNNQINRNST
jgi:hypothetical protein